MSFTQVQSSKEAETLQPSGNLVATVETQHSLDGYGTGTLPSFPRGRSSAGAGSLVGCWLG